jgi:two-component system chemotaxis sensor kinase CheA
VLAELDAAHAQAELTGGATALLAFIGGLVSQSASQSQPAAPAAVAERDQFAAGDARGGAAQTLRVEQHRVDALMKLIGELVVAKNALAYLARQAEDGALGVRELAREIKDRQALVNRIAEEMQAAVMAVRMLPVDHVFQRFPRLVRDTARRLGKRVELVVEGGETEADKNVIEALADPLIHMVRNSLDHGIEQPADRLAAGKAEQGTIRLLAMQDNDNVVIRIADDGRGIDPAIVKRKAVEKGLLDADRAAAISDADAIQLVFLPGFSTAAAISDLSGRGVGMDVVRSAVEKAGGRVSLDSCKGQGTRVEVTLPLSMSVTRIMTVALGSRLFGVPMPLVVETVRIPRTALRMVRDREIFVLRDSVVPVVRLARLLNLPDEDRGADEQAVLVVRLNGERLGIVVGAFREGMEVIVKPMEGVLAGLRGFSGTTLLGDGRVLLILDLRELVD